MQYSLAQYRAIFMNNAQYRAIFIESEIKKANSMKPMFHLPKAFSIHYPDFFSGLKPSAYYIMIEHKFQSDFYWIN